ncbi:MAG: hypothetical protein II773_08985 [Oscillospiraceae bacterium]|nr:hypothetical protein [Oscillospiraceae bacterium]
MLVKENFNVFQNFFRRPQSRRFIVMNARRCGKYVIFCKNIEKIMTNLILCVIIVDEGSITALGAVIEQAPVMLFLKIQTVIFDPKGSRLCYRILRSLRRQK